ncbi:Restriction endonuclease [uncultured Desulfatiglans sp.]|uniref:Restriction endonuclease n=1 Tax=Uncultured Desulfatiglans sp. TaxID=1748965 RepID=A0A653AA10_UNCDX|nr:Restriction endonuclease [uncultured Desulfatiglans sp.]
MKTSPNLPALVQFFLPIIDALKKLGGSASPSELKDELVVSLEISEDELSERFGNNVFRVDMFINWAKAYLTREGLLDVSDPHVWRLTEDGLRRHLTEQDVKEIFHKIHSGFITKKRIKRRSNKPIITDEEQGAPHGAELIEILKALSPEGFERLCQRLLRSSGFIKVVVKGRSGDGGIDGEGILEINPLVSLKVIFQAKRYKDAVPSSQVRDFRGAMQGRAEKGIFITTGRFTQEAKNEAIREGVPPIELVDGSKLVKLFEQTSLGLKPRTIYEIDNEFFHEYR